MPYTRFVEIGRLALVQYGKEEGKLGFITEIIDTNHVIVDGPTTGLKKQVAKVSHLVLTPYKMKIPRNLRSTTLKKRIAKDDTLQKFQKSAWGMKLQKREIRSKLTDFQRFQVKCLKRIQRRMRKEEKNKKE